MICTAIQYGQSGAIFAASRRRNIGIIARIPLANIGYNGAIQPAYPLAFEAFLNMEGGRDD